jgi:hypothetical protein
MPGEIELPDLPDPGSLRRGRFTYLPVVPGRLEFAIEVRQAILRDKPQVVALELPARCNSNICARWRGCRRCPSSSIPTRPREEERAIYVPVEPADPFVEAIRTRTRRARTWSSPTRIRASGRT